MFFDGQKKSLPSNHDTVTEGLEGFLVVFGGISVISKVSNDQYYSRKSIFLFSMIKQDEKAFIIKNRWRIIPGMSGTIPNL